MDQIVVFRCSPVLRQALLLLCALVTPIVVGAQTTTTTTLTVSPATTPPVATHTVVTLTATVTAGSTPVHPGLVRFCDTSDPAKCVASGLAVLGTAQLTSAGTAVFRYVPGDGTHHYLAAFVGTTTYSASTSTLSSAVEVDLPLPYATTTTITASPTPPAAGPYTLTATVTNTGSFTLFPTTGSTPETQVEFTDTTSNTSLGTASLGTATLARSFLNASGSPITVGSQPNRVAVGDFNEDGIPDVAVADANASIVNILLGNGDGTFTQSSITVGPPSAQSVVVGDFNGDGIADFAVALGGSSTSPAAGYVGIWLGNGDGTFHQASGSPIATGGTNSYDLAVGDFNHDGIADLAIVNPYTNNLTILLGNGDGTFTRTAASPIAISISPISTSPQPRGVAVGNFTSSGNQDLAIGNYGNASGEGAVTILLGNGDGTFTQASGSPYATGGQAYDPTVAYFTGSGHQDIAAPNWTGNQVLILLGNGDGTFTVGTPIALTGGLYTTAAAILDFNGDGIADVAASIYQTSGGSTSGRVSLWLGNGDGTFTQASGSPFSTGTYGTSGLKVADFNGDGHPDFATANLQIGTTTGTVSILLDTPTWTATASLSGVTVSPPGVHPTEATYPGDANFSGSTSGTVPLVGVPVSTTTSLALTSQTITFGEPVTLTAIVTPTTSPGLTPGATVAISGTVSFYNNGTLLGTAVTLNSANGEAVLVVNGSPIPNFAVGTHTLTAVYNGDTNFSTSTSTAQTLTVNTVQTTVELFSSLNPSTYGQAVTFTATVPSAATGTIQFQIDGADLGGPVTISSGTAAITTTATALTAGTHVITAVYSGDTSHSASTGTLSQLVEPAALTVTATDASRVFGQPNPTFAYTITGFVGSDTQSVVTGTPTLLTTATLFSPPRSYPIVVRPGTLAASNYTFTFVYGTLTIAMATPGTGGTAAVTVASSLNPSTWGHSVTFIATVPTNATGTVTFMDGSTTLGTGTITANQAQFSTTSLVVETHPITAVYGGDTNFNGATSAVLSQVVDPAILTVTANDAERLFGQSNPPFTAELTGFVNGDTAAVVTGTPSLNTTATTASPVGTYPITAAQGTLAAANYEFTFVNGVLLITSITPTITIVSSANPSHLGSAVTFTATAPAGATGTVSFLDGEDTLGTGTITGNTATFTTSALAAGTHSITAVYNGDANHNAASSAALSQLITVATIILSSSVNPQVLGLPVTITAEVIPTPTNGPALTGTVTFSEGTTVLGSAAVNSGGIATFTTSSLIEGTHTITAVYSGDANYPQGAGSLDQVIVASLPETIEPTGGNDQSAVYGIAFAQPLSVVVMLSNGTPAAGVSVTFAGAGLNISSGGSVTTDSNGMASVTATGTHVGGFVATATAAGVSQLVSFALTVTPAQLTVTASNATRPFGADNPAFTGTVTGAVFGDTFTASGTTTAVLNSPAGTYPITPTISGPALTNYTVTKVNGTLTVTKVAGSVSLTASPDPAIEGSQVTLTATVPAGATGTVTFYDGTTALGTATIVNGTATLIISTLAVGTHTITAVYNGDTNFTAATSSAVTLVINSAADFDVSSPTPTQIVPPGAAAGFAVHIPSVTAPFNNPVTLTATGLPAGATYTFNPNPVTPGAGGINSTLTVNVPRQSAMLDRRYRTPLVLAVLIMPFAVLRRARGRPQRLLLWLLVALASFVVMNGCGSGGYFNQPQRTYIITVTGTSGNLVHSTTVTLTVQ